MEKTSKKLVKGSSGDGDKYYIEKILCLINRLVWVIEPILILGILCFAYAFYILVKEEGLSMRALLALGGVLLGAGGILVSVLSIAFAILGLKIALILGLPELSRQQKRTSRSQKNKKGSKPPTRKP